MNEKIKNIIKEIFKYVSALCIFLFFLHIISLINSENVVVEVIYNDTSLDKEWTELYYDTGKGYNEFQKYRSEINDGKAVFKVENVLSIESIRIDPISSNNIINLKSIDIISEGNKISVDSTNFEKYAHHYNLSNFEIVDNIIKMIPVDVDPVIELDNKSVGLIFKKDINESIQKYAGLYTFYNMIFVLLSLAATGLYIKFFNRIFLFLSTNVFTVVKVLIILTGVYIVTMALITGENNHPDEFMAKSAIGYYNEHIIPPDIRNLDVSYYSTIYGVTRLSEKNLYYLFAGKVENIGNFFGIDKSYRLFNILLALTILFILYRKSEENPWLLMGFFLTPQVWYIFSYATSDAFDYFLSFLIFYQLSVKTSLLNNLLSSNEFRINIRNILTVLYVSILFGFLLLGKPNYYVVHILSAYILLYKLYNTPKEKWLVYIKYITVIALISLSIYAGRQSIEVYRYGFNGKAVRVEMKERYAVDYIKPSTPISESGSTFFLHEKGVSLKDLLIKYNFLEGSLLTAVGAYGYLSIYATYDYYKLIYAVYILMFLFMVYYLVKDFTINKLCSLLFLISIAGISVLLSVYHSWFNEVQTQGRYLLPAIFSLGIMYAAIWKKEQYKILVWFLIITHIISSYSFVTYGIIKTLWHL